MVDVEVLCACVGLFLTDTVEKVPFVTVAQAQTTGPIPVTGEQSGAIRCGVGGAKGRGRGECEPTKHARTPRRVSVTQDVGSSTASNCRRYPRWSECGKAARTDLAGAQVTRVPTANVLFAASAHVR